MKILLHNNINDAIQKYNLNFPTVPNQAGITCEKNNILIGFLYYTNNYFHPYSIYLHFKFLIKNPGVDLLNEMFNLLKMKVPNFNYILNLEPHYPFYIDFINDNNFMEIRKTYEPEVSIDQLICHYKYINSHSISINSPFVITDKLVYKVQDTYRSTHVVNPLGKISMQEWKTVIKKNLDIENSVVIYDENNEITAYMLIFHETESIKEIGWVYYRDKAAKTHLLKQFNFTLYRLKNSGIKTIGLEVDNTDTYAYDLFSPFVDHKDPSLITYMKHK